MYYGASRTNLAREFASKSVDCDWRKIGTFVPWSRTMTGTIVVLCAPDVPIVRLKSNWMMREMPAEGWRRFVAGCAPKARWST